MKSWGVLLLGFMFAAVGAWATLAYIDARERALRESLLGENNMVDVVVPIMDLVPGDAVNFENVSARPMPEDYMPDSTIHPDEFELLEGMILTEPVSKGKPLLRGNLLGLTRVDSFASLLKKGQRPITLEIDGLQSNAGMLSPGDMVDIVLRVSGGQEQTQSADGGQEISLDSQMVLLLEKVVVLATDQRNISQPNYLYDESADLTKDYDTITVAVDVEDVSAVMTARQMATNEGVELAYLMRNPEDKASVDYQGNALIASTSLVQAFAGGQANDGELKLRLSKPNSVMGVKYQGKNVKKFQKFVPGPVYLEQPQQRAAQAPDAASNEQSEQG
ncbi:MAG: Flp pilus assembly protein CpaB [Pseudomonadales bacterium]|nr:Flp pilus assembly protein CpaB [Pseudomonadales bacterium]